MKLRVRASGTALVQDLEAFDAGVRRYIGRQLDPTQGEVYKDAEGVQRRQAVFVPLDKPQEVPARAEYVRAVRDGDLEAADQATAEYCGVKLAKESSK